MNSTKQKTPIKQAAHIVANKQSVALFAHTNPDGDTIGASIALCLALRKMGKNCNIFCDSVLSEKLSSFEHTNLINKSFFGKYDLMVAVDCGDIFRLGEFSGIYNNFAETLTVDHHGGEYYSKYNTVCNIASTCQIVFDIIKEMNVDIDGTIATYLYMGLCTDTGNFAHSNTDCDCFLTASELCRLGADIQKPYRVFFKDVSLAETKLMARVVNRMRSFYDDKMFLLYVTKADLEEFGLDSTATSGLVSYAINVDTACCGVCITEYANEVYKVSMRGKDFSVRDVCKEFGGGGHLLASGCMINGMLEDVIEKIVRVVGFTI